MNPSATHPGTPVLELRPHRSSSFLLAAVLKLFLWMLVAGAVAVKLIEPEYRPPFLLTVLGVAVFVELFKAAREFRRRRLVLYENGARLGRGYQPFERIRSLRRGRARSVASHFLLSFNKLLAPIFPPSAMTVKANRLADSASLIVILKSGKYWTLPNLFLNYPSDDVTALFTWLACERPELLTNELRQTYAPSAGDASLTEPKPNPV